MKDNGRKINKMAMAKRFGLTKLFTKANITTERSMDRELSCGKMTAHIKANSFKTTFMALGPIRGKMGECIQVSGRTTKWKEKEFLHG